MTYSIPYIKILRGMMDMQGLQHVQIVAADQAGFDIVNDLIKDPQLAKIVNIIG